MDLYNIKPIEDSRLARDAMQNRAQQPARPEELDAARGQQPASEPPKEGGPVAASPAERGQTQEAAPELQTRERQSARRDLLEAFAKMANVPPDTRLTIEVDVSVDETRFQILNKDTGEVLREVPEPEAAALLRQLSESSGAFVDHRF